MTMLLWWSVASIAISLCVGAFLAFGRREPEMLDLDLESARTLAMPQASVPDATV